MPNTDSQLSLSKCAQNLQRSEEEIKKTLIDLGLRTRTTRGMFINADEVLKLSKHFDGQKKITESKQLNSRGTRKISSTEVVQRKRIERPKKQRASMAELRQQKRMQSEGTAEPVTPDTPATPAPATVAAKTVQVKKAARESDTAAAAAETAAPNTGKDAPAKKKTARKKTAAKAAASADTAQATPSTRGKKKTAAPAPAAEPAAEPVTEPEVAPAAAKKAAAAKTPAMSSMEQLLEKQIAHKEEQDKKEKQLRDAAEKKQQKKSEAKPDSKKGGRSTLSLDKKAIEKRRKKRQKNISRTEAREKTSENQHVFQKPTAPVIRMVKIPEAISVAKLAGEMALKSGIIIRKLMDHGMTVTANELLDRETAWIIVEELGHQPIDAPTDDSEEELLKRNVDGTDIQPRAPVVTVMGHVDHGKTSLLDYIRKTRVASGEAGGITQHIGAYRVDTATGPVTFLDTPGHALFSQMRARGAKVTDLVVLVVAADDGVKPQTVEAINHAKTANVPIIVAANKIDKPETDIEKVKRELANCDVLPEDWGGDTMVIPVSAETGKGVEQLLESLAMQTELLELKAPRDVQASGVVIEARVDKGRGIVATLIVTRGIIRRGDAFLCGTESGRVRMMWDAATPRLEAAYPSMPLEMQGLSNIPEAGTELMIIEDERTAREVASIRQDKSRVQRLMSHQRPLLSANDNLLLAAPQEKEEWKELNVVVKADVEGAREALVAALSAISGKKAGVKVIHSAVGTVTESDIYLAQTGNGIIVGFNVRPDSRVRKLAESRGIKIISDNVVYELVEKTHQTILGLLDPITEEIILGNATVQQVFNISKIGNIAGCRVEEGFMRAKSPVRLLRDGSVVYEGIMSSLFHFKDQVSEVRAGSECGIGISRYNDIKIGDVIESLERKESAPPEL